MKGATLGSCVEDGAKPDPVPRAEDDKRRDGAAHVDLEERAQAGLHGLVHLLDESAPDGERDGAFKAPLVARALLDDDPAEQTQLLQPD